MILDAGCSAAAGAGAELLLLGAARGSAEQE